MIFVPKYKMERREIGRGRKRERRGEEKIDFYSCVLELERKEGGYNQKKLLKSISLQIILIWKKD